MDPTVVLAITALAAAVGYLAACAVWPFGNCRRCHGTSKLRSPSGRAFRHCRKCKGTGRRVRAGRRLYERLRAEQRHAEPHRNRGQRRGGGNR